MFQCGTSWQWVTLETPRSFECLQLHNCKGLDALFDIALGFVKAATDGVDNPNNEEYQLGPVVTRHGKHVVKAYDDPSYCQPNRITVKTRLDNDNTLWRSQDSLMEILEMP